MGIIDTPVEFFPRPPISHSLAPSFHGSLQINGADERVVIICDPPKTGNIDAIDWGTRTVTTGSTCEVRVETLNRGATPSVNSGTLWGTNTNANQVVGSGDDNTGFTTVLTAAAAVTRGTPIAVVIKQPTASFGDLIVAALQDDHVQAFPYSLLNGAVQNIAACIALRYDDGLFYPVFGCYPITAITTTTFNSGSTPDVIGNRFMLPVARRTCGFWAWADNDGDMTVKLVSDDYHQANNTATLKVERTVTNQDRFSNGSGIEQLYFPTDVTLNANTWYRLIYEPGGSNISLYDMTFRSLALMAGIDGGANWHLTTAKDPTGDGSWTNYNSGTFRRQFGGIIFNGIDHPGFVIGG